MSATITLLQPRFLAFGSYCSRQLVEHLKRTGTKRTFVVLDAAISTVAQPVLASIAAEHIAYRTFEGIRSEPSSADFAEALSEAEQFGVDTVIGIGGGSVLDVAKLVAAMYQSGQSIDEVFGIGNLRSRSIASICLPTTAGTGSEMSPNSLLIDVKSGTKKGIVSPFLVPDASFVDPALTLTVPKPVTMATGIDAMIHCIEAYANKFSHPLIDSYAIRGIGLINSNLVKAYRNGHDLDARAAVSLGSMFGGICLGPVNTAGVHALAYPLGSRYHLSHGLSNALLLPHVLRFNLEAAADRYADIAVAMGAQRRSTDLQTAEAGIRRIEELFVELEVPRASTIVDAAESDIAEMAREAMTVTRLLKNNVRTIAYADAVDIYTNMFQG